MLLKKSGLTINPGKCHIGWTQVKYLGYIIGQGQVRAQPDKVQALKQATRPKNREELQRFLGLARCFAPHFASHESPLTTLLQKGQPKTLQWTSATLAALQDLRSALATEPVLQMVQPGYLFGLFTDVSAKGIGDVLSQKTPQGERQVQYLSRQLDPVA